MIYARRIDLGDGGTALTLAECERLGKPYFVVLTGDEASYEPEMAAAWIRWQKVRTLNVAGPRESQTAEVDRFVEWHLAKVIEATMHA